MNVHLMLDFDYGAHGDHQLIQYLRKGGDPNAFDPNLGEALIHVATRRRRINAITILLDFGANINVKTHHGKTAYTHAVRRGFDEIAALLGERGATTDLNNADRFAVVVNQGSLKSMKQILANDSGVIMTGNPEEDRILADMAGRNDSGTVSFLIQAGADLNAPGLDGGTPLHQAAWFGQPENARLLLAAGAHLDIFDPVHRSSPIGWAVHGSRYSGGATERQKVYNQLVEMLLQAGASLVYPDAWKSDLSYLDRLKKDASPSIRAILPATSS